MTPFYFDSSALVKRYAKEQGTVFVIGLMRPSTKNILYSAKITEIEVCSALARRRKGLTLTPSQAIKSKMRFQRTFSRRFFSIDLIQTIIAEAIRLTDM